MNFDWLPGGILVEGIVFGLCAVRSSFRKIFLWDRFRGKSPDLQVCFGSLLQRF